MNIIKIKDAHLPLKEKEIEVPIVEEPIVEDPIEPVVEEPIVEEPTTEEPPIVIDPEEEEEEEEQLSEELTEDEPEMEPAIDPIVFAYVKDKYCYLINWKWIVPFSYSLLDEETGEEHSFTFTKEQYIECSKNDHAPENYPYADYEEYVSYGLIDIALTEKANSIARFIESNNFSSDSDITLDELKKFRTWLAQTLLRVLVDVESYEITEMLNYYANNMYDSTVQHLKHFVPKKVTDVLTATAKNTCGCASQSNANLIGSVTTCDALSLYSKAVYEKMVEVFSDISFWSELEPELLLEIKKYIDGIIHHNLPLYTVDYVSDLYDCGCLSDADASQERLMGYLASLSKAFGFMAEGAIQGNRNFIGDALNRWAAYLYERMYWV